MEPFQGRQVEMKEYSLTSANPMLHKKEEALQAALGIPVKADKHVCY
jgi:hypothetical protein